MPRLQVLRLDRPTPRARLRGALLRHAAHLSSHRQAAPLGGAQELQGVDPLSCGTAEGQGIPGFLRTFEKIIW